LNSLQGTELPEGAREAKSQVFLENRQSRDWKFQLGIFNFMHTGKKQGVVFYRLGGDERAQGGC